MKANLSFFLGLMLALAITILGHRGSQEGYISIDCGIHPPNRSYTDIVTGINYSPDDSFITTGVNFKVSQEYGYPQNANLPAVLAEGQSFPSRKQKLLHLKTFKCKR